jgi:hypothetical protein
MSDPIRLLERLDTLPAELQSALGGAPGSPPPAELQQLADRLSEALSLPVGAPLTSPVGASLTVPASGSLPGALKVLGALLVGAALGGGGSALLSTLGSSPAALPSPALHPRSSIFDPPATCRMAPLTVAA